MGFVASIVSAFVLVYIIDILGSNLRKDIPAVELNIMHMYFIIASIMTCIVTAIVIKGLDPGISTGTMIFLYTIILVLVKLLSKIDVKKKLNNRLSLGVFLVILFLTGTVFRLHDITITHLKANRAMLEDTVIWNNASIVLDNELTILADAAGQGFEKSFTKGSGVIDYRLLTKGYEDSVFYTKFNIGNDMIDWHNEWYQMNKENIEKDKNCTYYRESATNAGKWGGGLLIEASILLMAKFILMYTLVSDVGKLIIVYVLKRKSIHLDFEDRVKFSRAYEEVSLVVLLISITLIYLDKIIYIL